MDLLSILESLARQVQSREISIATACSRVENFISALGREDGRSLRHSLPVLLKLVLGSQEAAGWLESLHADSFSWRSDSEAVRRLLSPHGVLFSALLGQAPDVGGLHYEIPANALPYVTRRALDAGQVDLLSSEVYEGRLACTSGAWVLRLNMVEYFIFYYLYVFSPEAGIVTRRIKENALHATFNKPISPATECYLKLLQEYFSFMAPMSKMSVDTSITPPDNIFTSQLLKSNSAVWSRLDLAGRFSDFFSGTLVELWMNVYSYNLDAASGLPFAEPAFILPSIDFLQALQITARHYANIYSVAILSFDPLADPIFKNAAEKAFDLIRLSFYRYLRITMAIWPIDGSLSILIDIWLSLISPWFQLDPAFAAFFPLDEKQGNFAVSWRPYVLECFFLYQSLYGEWFTIAEAALSGFAASEEFDDLDEIVPRLNALISSLVESMSPILSTFEIIKRLELDALRSSSILQTSNAEMSCIRSQLKTLEPEAFRPMPLFEGDRCRNMVLSLLKHLKMLTRLVFTRHHSLIAQASSNNDLDDEDTHERKPAIVSDSDLIEFILNCIQVPEAVKNMAKWSLQLHEDLNFIFNIGGSEHEHDKFTKAPPVRRRMLRPPSNWKAGMEQKLSARRAVHGAWDPIPRAHEVDILVPLLVWLSMVATDFWRNVILTGIEAKWKIQLPKRIWQWKLSFRFFASYSNLFFVLVVLLMLKGIVSIVF